VQYANVLEEKFALQRWLSFLVNVVGGKLYVLNMIQISIPNFALSNAWQMYAEKVCAEKNTTDGKVVIIARDLDLFAIELKNLWENVKNAIQHKIFRRIIKLKLLIVRTLSQIHQISKLFVLNVTHKNILNLLECFLKKRRDTKRNAKDANQLFLFRSIKLGREDFAVCNVV